MHMQFRSSTTGWQPKQLYANILRVLQRCTRAGRDPFGEVLGITWEFRPWGGNNPIPSTLKTQAPRARKTVAKGRRSRVTGLTPRFSFDP